jgi:hypothetical protein
MNLPQLSRRTNQLPDQSCGGLHRLVKSGKLERVGEKRGSFYELAKKEK